MTPKALSPSNSLDASEPLTDRGCSYSFTLNLWQSFNFSLTSEKGAPPKAKPKRSPSYLRRQLRRREDFLKKRSGSSAENVDAASRHTQPNQNEETAEDNSCHLDLRPRPVDPRKSEGSVKHLRFCVNAGRVIF